MKRRINKYLVSLIALCFFVSAFGQKKSDAEVITNADRTINPAYRITLSPELIDTTLNSSSVKYPLLSLQKETAISVSNIDPASVRLRPQLNELYNCYAKFGVGSRLQVLGKLYIDSKRSRKYHWGFHALHHSEWGKIKEYAPSQYDKTQAKLFGTILKKRYTYGGGVNYNMHGLNYYGFKNPDAPRDSINQRYQDIGAHAFIYSHVKDSFMFNYRIGVKYNYFGNKRPDNKALKKWHARENYVGLNTHFEYNGKTSKLLSNLAVDFDWAYNGYRYGVRDSALTQLDTAIHSDNVIAKLRPMFSFFGVGKKLKFKVGGEIALDYRNKAHLTLYPIAEAKYSLFNDIFIPYIGIKGGLVQQRFAKLAKINPFINSNQQLLNEHVYDFYFGIKGTVSSKVSFNASFSYARLTNHALFVNDTIYSSGNQFRAIYDTITRATITASLSYQQNEKLKVDLIGHFYSYQTKVNPYAWNLPQFKVITRATYNVFDRLITRLDFTLETGRYTKVFDPDMEGVKIQDGVYYKKLGVLADVNLEVEFRYSKRFSIFADFNNIAAQSYQRWMDYPVNAFQFMAGVTFRF